MKEGRREGNVLFNNVLNTFYLWLYGVRHMVKDHSHWEKGNPLLPHGLLFPINSKGFFYMHHPTDRITYTMAFVTTVVEHWLEQEIAQWVHPMKDRSDDPLQHERTLLPQSYILLPCLKQLRNIYHINERGRKEGNVLFNDTLNTFYFMVIWCRTYGKGPLR